MRRSLTASLAVSLLMLLSACGGDAGSPGSAGSASGTSAAASSSAAEDGGGKDNAKPFTITEQEHRVSSSFGDTYVHWTVVIENPNADVYGTFPTVSVTGRDAAGKVVGTDDQVLDSLPPGGTIAFSGQASMTEKPAKVEIAYKSVDWYDTKTTAADYPPFTVSDISVKKQEFGGLVVTGEVANPYKYAVSSLAATALFRNASGKLIGGTTSFLEDLPAAASMPMQVEELGGSTPAKKVKSTDVIVTTWGDPQDWNDLAAGEDPEAD
jgi:hypothetical protein